MDRAREDDPRRVVPFGELAGAARLSNPEPGKDQHRPARQRLDSYSNRDTHGPAGEPQTARPTPGGHSPSPALRRSGTARAARACSAALRPARRRERRAGWTPGTAAHPSVLQAGFLKGPQPHARMTTMLTPWTSALQ